jgi:hypothetical protein
MERLSFIFTRRKDNINLTFKYVEGLNASMKKELANNW